MNVGKPKDDFVFEDNTTGEHRVVPRLYIRPRSDYEGKNSVRAKPDLNSIKFSLILFQINLVEVFFDQTSNKRRIKIVSCSKSSTRRCKSFLRTITNNFVSFLPSDARHTNAFAYVNSAWTWRWRCALSRHSCSRRSCGITSPVIFLDRCIFHLLHAVRFVSFVRAFSDCRVQSSTIVQRLLRKLEPSFYVSK